MTQNRRTIVVLCEDRQQYLFALYFLKKKGFAGNFVAQICPSGKQAGEQYVRDRYAAEVKAHRSKRNHLNICLVMMIDADVGTVANRIRQLDASLEEKHEAKRQEKENIAIFVPKRNIETWIHYLQGDFHEVNEDTAYSKLANQGECKPYVEKLADRCSLGLPQSAPSSMHDACSELQRIL
jgi:hypothetical protein